MKFIPPSTVRGALNAPSSKSVLQRALFAACLGDEPVKIYADSWCEDSLAARGVIQGLGAKVEVIDGGVVVRGAAGCAAREVDCGESGLCMRMASAVAATYGRGIKLNGRGSLLKRPVQMVEHPLRTLGVECASNRGFPPLSVKGPIRGGAVDVDGSQSSQFLTGLLMALPLSETDSEVRVRDLKSRPYIDLTIQVLADFGIHIEHDSDYCLFKVPGRQKYRCAEFRVEGDWSGSSCLLVAGALIGEVEIKGLRTSSAQADKAIIDVLGKTGAALEVGPDSVKVKRGTLHAFSFDATDCPDLFPALVALSCGCQGTSKIIGTTRLINKESNRLEALAQEFSRLGALIEVQGDEMRITGRRLEGGRVDSHGDHRIAMSVAVAGLISSRGVEISGDESVAKSYPQFFDHLRILME